MRAVRATVEDAARVVLVEAMAAKPGGLLIEADFVERDGTAVSAELADIVAGTLSDGAVQAVALRPQDRS